ncbi:MAG: hypothetical protein PHF21_02750 [Bacilli bacterium]|nr:hypothetical protein [Bacilli bacterium]
MTTPEFIDKLVKNEIDLDEKVNISARELFALISENADIVKDTQKRLAESTHKILKLEEDNTKLKFEINQLNFKYLKLSNDYSDVKAQELLQRKRVSLLESTKTVSYTKGDIYSLCV